MAACSLAQLRRLLPPNPKICDCQIISRLLPTHYYDLILQLASSYGATSRGLIGSLEAQVQIGSTTASTTQPKCLYLFGQLPNTKPCAQVFFLVVRVLSWRLVMISVTDSCCVLAVAFKYCIFRSYRMPVYSLFSR
jgi:hypothetical protein